MAAPSELSEAHLQDHELLSAALEATCLSPVPTAATVAPFLRSTSQLPPLQSRDLPEPENPPNSSTLHSPDALTTPRLESSRSLSSPPSGLRPSLHPSDLAEPPTVKFTLLKKDTPALDSITSTRELAQEAQRLDRPEPPVELQGRDSASHDEPDAAETSNGNETGPELDPVLLAALKHHRDRFLLLRAEVEMERFLANPQMTRLPLAPPHFQPALNSYQRLLVHRLADTFGITREVEAAPPSIWNAGAINPATGQPQGVVVLVKGENTRLPSAKLASYAVAPEPPATVPSAIMVPSPSSTPSIASSPVTSAAQSGSTSSLPNLVDAPTAAAPPPAAPQILKILPRSSASRTASSASSSIGTDEDPATSSSAPTSAKGKGRRELTLEEREAAYKEARERIFSQPEQERGISSGAAASSIASEDVSTRLTSAGAGITRPSSAGSTFSRSSAAMSIAGSRPSPSVASESGSSMWSGHHGGMYGGGSQLMPSLRPSAPSFDPSLVGGWTHEQGYMQDPAWQQQHYQHSYPQQHSPHPPIQVTGPSPHPAYAAPSPSYPSSSTSHVAAPMSGPFQPAANVYPQIDPWGRSVPPPLPSPSLSTSSGNSLQRPHPSHRSSSPPAPNERRSSGMSGYLMRFAGTGAVVAPGGTVTAGIQPAGSPSSSMFAGPPSTTRSVSSFSSTSQHSSSSGGNSLRTGSSSTGSGVHNRNPGALGGGGTQLRRPSASLTSSVSSARSLRDRKDSVGTDSEAGLEGDSARHERQATVKSHSSDSGGADANRSDSRGRREKSPLHPSLPAKPTWTAPASDRPRSPTRSNLPGNIPAAQASYSSPINNRQILPPQLNHTHSPAHQHQAPFPPQTTQSNVPFYAPSSHSFPSPQPAPSPSQTPGWNRPAGMHYPAGASSFAPAPGPAPVPPQYPQGMFPPPGAGGPNQTSNWNYAQPLMMPPVPPLVPHPASTRGVQAQDSMPFPDMRRPPPKSTQLFDPNRPATGGGGGSGMRRGASGTGSTRSGAR
ncbi:R3H and SUZ domain-containing protein [Sporobolomyces koalae]|uniref:R3H and SUZ domain-containing protein n=1 Tax=Sporobolomyces koalae TaxID=500713 RepID=UPI003172EB90